MTWKSLILAGGAGLVFVAAVVACSSDPDAPASKAPFGCCALDATPPSCIQISYGRAKRSADDNCIDGYDGTIPDPKAPGWTQSPGDDGCPRWVAPASAPKITCGAVPGKDASVDAAEDAHVVDVAPKPGLFVALCRTALGGTPETDLRFWVEASLASASDAGADASDDAGDAGAGPALSLVMTPLVGWKNGAPAPPSVVTASSKIGSPVSASGPVAANTVYHAPFGAVAIPGDGNSVSGRDLAFSELTLDGTFTGLSKAFCGRLSGKLTAPTSYELLPDKNTCLLFPIGDGSPLPEPAPADFVCPLP